MRRYYETTTYTGTLLERMCHVEEKKKQKRVEYKFVRFFIKSVEFFNIFLR